MFSGIVLVGLLLLGILVLGASLAAKTDTRAAGLWIMGITFALAVLMPLAWLFFGYGLAHSSPSYVRGGDGRMIAVHEPASAAAPMFAMFLIGIVVVGGLIALLINERTRKAGFVVLGFLGICFLGYIVVGTTSMEVHRGAANVAQSPPSPVRGATMVVEERHQIPVDESIAERTLELVPAAPPVPTEATTPPPATPPPVAPPIDSPPAAPSPGESVAAAPPPASAQPVAAPATAVSSVAPPGALGNVQVTTGDKNALPEWAKQGGGIAPDGTYFTVVKCGPHLKFDDCWRDLRGRVDSAANDHRIRYAIGENFRPPNRPLPEPVRNQLMTDHFLEQGDSSVGETMTLYTRVAFTREATAAIRSWQADLLAENRMIFATIFGALVVGLIGITYGYFRIDTATLGYYTWRLRFVALFLVAGIVICGIAAGAVFFEEEWRRGGINF